MNHVARTSRRRDKPSRLVWHTGRENGSAPTGRPPYVSQFGGSPGHLAGNRRVNEGAGGFIAFHGSHVASVTSPKRASRRPIKRLAKSFAPRVYLHSPYAPGLFSDFTRKGRIKKFLNFSRVFFYCCPKGNSNLRTHFAKCALANLINLIFVFCF